MVAKFGSAVLCVSDPITGQGRCPLCQSGLFKRDIFRLQVEILFPSYSNSNVRDASCRQHHFHFMYMCNMCHMDKNLGLREQTLPRRISDLGFKI